MKFVGIKTAQITETPTIGDIIEVDYTKQGVVPDTFRTGGHGRGRYLCQATEYSGGDVHLEVLYDVTRNRPFSAKNRSLYIGQHERKGKTYYGTTSGAVASNSLLTRREVNLLIDEYNKRKKEA